MPNRSGPVKTIQRTTGNPYFIAENAGRYKRKLDRSHRKCYGLLRVLEPRIIGRCRVFYIRVYPRPGKTRLLRYTHGMATSQFRSLRDQLDGVFAQGLRLTSATALASLMQACSTTHLSQPAALLQHIRHQIEQGRIDQKTAEPLVKAMQTLKQAEILTSTPETVDVSAIQKVRPGKNVYLAREQITPAESATLDDLLAVPNPFARTAQVIHYLQHAGSDDLRRSIELIWFDYSLLTAIRTGLASRPDDAFQLAELALASNNLVTQCIALAVLESLGAQSAYRRPAIDLLRERAKKVKEPLKYVFMETIATLEGTLPVYRMAQQKFFNEHAAFIRQLSSKKKTDRGKALKALGRTKNPCFTQALLAMLDDPEVAQVAIDVSVKIGAFPAIPRLAHMLSGSLQRNAALALHHFGDLRGLEFWLRHKLQYSLEHSVSFADYGPLLLHPLMRVIRQLRNPAENAKGCWEIFNANRSQNFAERVRHYAERDPVLARQLAAIIKHAYPGQYACIVTSEVDAASEHQLQTLIMTTLGPNPHKLVATLKDKYLIDTILVTPDGAYAVTLNGHGDVSVWNTATWKKSTTFALPHGRQYNYLHAVTLSVDGRYLLATNGKAPAVDVFEFHRWQKPVASLRQAGEVYGIGTTSDGRYVLGGGKEHVTVWEWGTWREVATLSGHQHGVEAIKAVPGQPIVITGDRQGTLQVWQQDTWKAITTLTVNSIIATSVACSPDGRFLTVVDTLATYLETKVRVWETATWSEVALFAIPSPTPISCFAFTLDGKYLITGSNDIKFFEVGTWQEKLTLSSNLTRALAVLPDGEHVIASQNVWKIDRAELA